MGLTLTLLCAGIITAPIRLDPEINRKIKTMSRENQHFHSFPLLDEVVGNIEMLKLSFVDVDIRILLYLYITRTYLYVPVVTYDPYGPTSLFFAKPLMKVPYEGRTHLRERGRKKPEQRVSPVCTLTYPLSKLSKRACLIGSRITRIKVVDATKAP